jgi:hypothetical protein
MPYYDNFEPSTASTLTFILYVDDNGVTLLSVIVIVIVHLPISLDLGEKIILLLPFSLNL